MGQEDQQPSVLLRIHAQGAGQQGIDPGPVVVLESTYQFEEAHVPGQQQLNQPVEVTVDRQGPRQAAGDHH